MTTATRTKTTWEAAPGAVLGADPQVIGEALEKTERKHGKLLAEYVVEDAKAEGHKLHDLFEWDNEKAGDKWRHAQAGYLIRSIVVRPVASEPAYVRGWVLVTTQAAGRHYQRMEVALADPETLEQVIARALREQDSWAARYGHIADFADIIAAARATREKLNGQ